MKKINLKILSIFLLVFSLCFGVNYKPKTYAENTSAKAMVVIEANSGRVLKSYNQDKKLANASTTKIVTFLTVLKYCQNFDEIVEVDDRAIGISGTSIYLKKGEKLSVKELLYGMMLVSGNDAATALALHICPSVKQFGELMTQEARNAGAKNSTFLNPHGLDEKGHITTAYDLAMITRECYKYPIFEEIVSTKNTKISNGENGYRYLKNKNKLLWTLEGANGVKTGFTDDAGRCLVSSCKRSNMHLICVVLNCGPMFEESAFHFEDCFSKYSMVQLLKNNFCHKNINVIDGKKENVCVYSKKGFMYPLNNMEQTLIKIEVNTLESIKAPIKKEQVVGEVKIYLDKHLLFSEKIYTMEDVESNSMDGNIHRILSNW